MDTALLTTALDAFGARLQAVEPDQWSSPTPCADWDVRALVNHVAGELLWIPPLLDGRTIAEVGDLYDGDVLGADPRKVWSAAVGDVGRAVRGDGVQERIVHLSFGDVPGSEYLGQVTSDLAIHAWDLARAIGADERLDARLVTFVDAFLSPQIELWRSAGVLGPAVDVADDVSVQERLLAQTGRTP